MAAGILLLPLFADCQEDSPSDVEIMAFPASRGEVVRMKMELESTGISVKTTILSEAPDEKGREFLASVNSAATALVFFPAAGDTIEMRLRSGEDPSQLKHLSLKVNSKDESELVMSAVELIRASLLKVDKNEVTKEEPSTKSAAKEPIPLTPKEPPQATPEKEHYRWFLELGGGILAAGFDSPPTGSVYLSATGLINDHLGLFAAGYIPISTSTKSTDGGDLKQRTGILGGGLQFLPLGNNQTFVPRLGLGFAALIHSINGRANAGFSDREQRVVTGAPLLRFFAGIHPGKRVLIGIEVAAGYSLSKTVIRSDGNEAVELGRPFLCATLLLRFSLL